MNPPEVRPESTEIHRSTRTSKEVVRATVNRDKPNRLEQIVSKRQGK